jgi:hypothetical protein
LQRDRANVAALFAALGAAQALFHRLERGIPAAHVGQQIGVSLSLVGARGTFQKEQVLPEFIAKLCDFQVAHSDTVQNNSTGLKSHYLRECIENSRGSGVVVIDLLVSMHRRYLRIFARSQEEP